MEALKLNPFMWDAFTGLCDMGASVRPNNIFKVSPEMVASLTHSAMNGSGAQASTAQGYADAGNPFVSTPEVDPFNTSTRYAGDIGLSLGGSNLLSKLNGSVPATNGHAMGSGYLDIETPTSNGQNIHDDDVMMGDGGGPVMNELGVEIPHAPGRKTRIQAFGATEDPPKMRPITSRTRAKMASETNEPSEMTRPGQNGHKRTVSGHSTSSTQQPAPSNDPTAAPPRRSVRLLNHITHIRPSSSRLATATGREPDTTQRRELRRVKATGTRGKTGATSTVGRVVSGNRKPTVEISDATGKPESRPTGAAATAMPPPKMAPPVDTAREQEALTWLLDLLRQIGSGYKQLSAFECVKAIEAFNAIASPQRETPWVLAQIGKAYYERSMYADAEKTFQRIRDKAPSYTEDMEVFSNTLWQLKKETDLAYLAHTLMDQDRLSPQAWCAIGNAFSLQREHDQAIKCFARATQLDPRFAYAFTLQGHEHVSNEEYDKAMMAYRSALSADNRHYNGWYGLGQVYEKLGKFEVAEKHYRAAADINPTNPLLAVRIGRVSIVRYLLAEHELTFEQMLDCMKRIEPALAQYDAAVQLDPRATPARYRRAAIYLKIGEPEEALNDLLYLKDVASDDANIHFALGRTYKRLGHRTNAIRHFTIAMNLDPKSQSIIKEAMEDWDEDDGGGWSSEEDDR